MARLRCVLLVLFTVPAVFAQHLYVADDNQTAGTIRQYTLPINGSSTPNFAIPINFVISVQTDAGGTLAAGELGGNIVIFPPPLSAASTPSVFHRAGASGADTDPAVSYSLNPGETQNIADLLPAMGQSGLGSADLIPTAGGFPTVVTRVFNDAGSSGTTGFTEDVPKLANALTVGDQYTLIVPSDLARFRYNIGVRSLASGASITVTERNSAGTAVRAVTKTYAPNYSAAAFLGAAPSANDSLVVSVDAGSLFIYGATTDNTTQDPSVQLGRK